MTDSEARGYGAKTSVAMGRAELRVDKQNCHWRGHKWTSVQHFNHQVLSANISEVTAIVYAAGCHEAAAGSSAVGRPFVAEDGSKLDFI